MTQSEVYQQILDGLGKELQQLIKNYDAGLHYLSWYKKKIFQADILSDKFHEVILVEIEEISKALKEISLTENLIEHRMDELDRYQGAFFEKEKRIFAVAQFSELKKQAVTYQKRYINPLNDELQSYLTNILRRLEHLRAVLQYIRKNVEFFLNEDINLSVAKRRLKRLKSYYEKERKFWKETKKIILEPDIVDSSLGEWALRSLNSLSYGVTTYLRDMGVGDPRNKPSTWQYVQVASIIAIMLLNVYYTFGWQSALSKGGVSLIAKLSGVNLPWFISDVVEKV